MGAHLQEVQEKFQQRFEKLEEEVRSRDQIINELQAHIMELEKAAATEESFGVSLTVLSKVMDSCMSFLLL